MKKGPTNKRQQALAGRVDVVSRSWEQTALDYPAPFEHGLQVSGLPESTVKDVLEVRNDVAAIQARLQSEIEDFYATTPNRYLTTPPEVERLYDAQYGAFRRLGDWFNERIFQVVDTQQVTLVVPLFSFGAADVKGCKTTYTITEDASRSVDWSLTVFGTGFGGSSKVEVSVTSSFSAVDGEVKVVFVNMTLPVELVNVIERGVVMGTEYRMDASKAKPSGRPGLRLLPEASTLAVGEVIDHFPLAGDTSGNPSDYEYDYKQLGALELTLGAEAFNAKLEASVRIERTTSLTLNLELIGGHDYELRRVVDQDGIAWSPTR